MAAQRDWYEKDFYKALGVAESATDKQITKAYRSLARDLHPDKNPGNDVAEEKFKEVSAAYDVLGDEDKRAEYDEVRRMGPSMMGGRHGGSDGFSFNVGDMGDVLGGMFGRGGRQRGGGGAGIQPRRGADVEASLTIDFADAVTGLETTLHLTAEAQCATCGGSGAKAGTAPKVCGQCSGRGVTDDNQGMFSFSSPCQICQGRGTVIESPCGTCSGGGIEKRPREVKTRLPAGVKDGQTIRLKGRGGPGRNGGPNGDLLVELTVIPHDRFGRSNQNLTVTVPVTFADAALGADIDVPTLGGPSVTMHIKPGTQSGSRHRVKSKGIETTSRAKGTVQGDLIVTVNVVVPTELSGEQRSAIEHLRSASTVEDQQAAPTPGSTS
ncbi:MAG: molecular chaperone DnaJ [Ilumatobacter sp.]|nr:molecular chaperone DnaJ [Ilumatobacter sp.]